MIKKLMAVFILIALLFHSCSKQKAAFAADPLNETKKVRAAAAALREFPDEVSGFGSLSFISKIDIFSPQDAVIKKIYFREGDFAHKGEMILRLENPQIQIAVERAQNALSQALAACNLASSRLMEGMFQAEAQLLSIEKAEKELVLVKRKWEEERRKHQNQETLFNAGGVHTEAILVSRFSLDSEWERISLMEKDLEIRKIGCRDQDLVKAGIPVPSGEDERREALAALMTSTLKSELEAAQAGVLAAEKELASVSVASDDLTVINPVSGTVGARYLEEGERVRAQDKILSIMDISLLYAIVQLREKDALRIEKGMKASVFVDGTGETREGRVDLVYPQADSQSLGFPVRILLKNADDKSLKPGMFARVTVSAGSPRMVTCIHESSIFGQKDGEGNVFIVNGSVLSLRKVKIGTAHGEEREIEGVVPGELVVLRPDSDLREGANVSVIE